MHTFRDFSGVANVNLFLSLHEMKLTLFSNYFAFGSPIPKGRHFEGPPIRRADNIFITLALALTLTLTLALTLTLTLTLTQV